MKTSLDCIPCFLDQALRAARRFCEDDARQRAIVQETLTRVLAFDQNRPAPVMGAEINRIVASIVGVEDAYKAEKRRFNEAAMAMLPALRQMVDNAADPFYTAARLALAGNIIDFTSPGGKTDGDLASHLKHLVAVPLAALGSRYPIAELKRATQNAEKILYLLDNAGEIVLDRLLVEQLPKGRVTLVVRGGPVANDVLYEDAAFAGIDALGPVIDSGQSLPGTLLAECSPALRDAFNAADLVISKGQGNFETLDFVPGRLWFLFIAKCRNVADYLGCSVGEPVVCDRPAR